MVCNLRIPFHELVALGCACLSYLTNRLLPELPRKQGHRGHVPLLLQMAGQRGTVSRRTANKKLTKL